MGILRSARGGARFLCHEGYPYTGEGGGVVGGSEYPFEFDFDLALGYRRPGPVNGYLCGSEFGHIDSTAEQEN